MTTVNKAFSPSNIFQGAADVWLGIGAPASAVPPVEYTNTLQLNSLGEPPDSNTTGSMLTAAVGTTGSGGSGYAIGDYLLMNAGGAVLRVASVSSGAVTAFNIIHPGSGYSVANNQAVTALTGVGTSVTVNVTAIQAGIHLGATDGPASLSISPKFNEIRADAHAAPIDVAFVSQSCEIDITIKEMVLKNFDRYFAGLLSGKYFNLVAGSTNPAADFLQIGSQRSSAMQTFTLMMIAPRRDSTTGWLYVMAYKAYLKSSFPIAMDRKKETSIKLKFGCIADTSRVVQDQVLQIVRY